MNVCAPSSTTPMSQASPTESQPFMPVLSTTFSHTRISASMPAQHVCLNVCGALPPGLPAEPPRRPARPAADRGLRILGAPLESDECVSGYGCCSCFAHAPRPSTASWSCREHRPRPLPQLCEKGSSFPAQCSGVARAFRPPP